MFTKNEIKKLNDLCRLYLASGTEEGLEAYNNACTELDAFFGSDGIYCYQTACSVRVFIPCGEGWSVQYSVFMGNLEED